VSDENKPEESSPVRHLKAVKNKKKTPPKENSPRKGSSTRPKSKPDVFITDERFKRAMKLIQQDMNRALTVAQTTNSQFYFLFQFLIKSGIVDEKEYEKFLIDEIEKMENPGKNKKQPE
jgi:hypothetical protein